MFAHKPRPQTFTRSAASLAYLQAPFPSTRISPASRPTEATLSPKASLAQGCQQLFLLPFPQHGESCSSHYCTVPVLVLAQSRHGGSLTFASPHPPGPVADRDAVFSEFGPEAFAGPWGVGRLIRNADNPRQKRTEGNEITL